MNKLVLPRDNVSSSYNKRYLPVLEFDKLKIYSFNIDKSVRNYIDSIKEKYSYEDILVCNDDVCRDLVPFNFDYGNGKLYDIIESFVSKKEDDNFRVGGVKKCDAVALVKYYPKLYFVLNQCLNSQIINLCDLGNYFKEYVGDNNYICDERRDREKLIDCILFDSVKMNINEVDLGISKIKDIVKNIPCFSEVTLEKEYDISCGLVSLNIDTSLDEFKKLKEYYYVGRVNSDTICYLDKMLLTDKKEYQKNKKR